MSLNKVESDSERVAKISTAGQWVIRVGLPQEARSKSQRSSSSEKCNDGR